MKLANRSGWGSAGVLILTLAFPSGSVGVGPPDKAQERLAAGKELFAREWIANDKRSYAGDGLGPVYNARSCVACHHQGGVGGAGGKETNTRIMSVFLPARQDEQQRSFIRNGIPPDPDQNPTQPSRDNLAKTIHPVLRQENSFPFHRFGQGAEYLNWKKSLFINLKDGIEVDDDLLETLLRGFPGTEKVDGIFVELIGSECANPFWRRIN